MYIAQRWQWIQRGKNGFKNDGISWKHHLSISDVESWLTCFSLSASTGQNFKFFKERADFFISWTLQYFWLCFRNIWLARKWLWEPLMPKATEFEELHSHKLSLVCLHCFWPNTSFKTKHAARVDTKPAVWPCVWLDSTLLSTWTGPTV